MWHCTGVTPVDVRAGNIDCEDSSSGEIAGLAVAKSPEPLAGVTTSPPSTALSVSQRLKALEDSILEKSLRTVDAALHWEDIDPGAEGPPQAWIDEVGAEEASKRFRVARAAWLNAKEAPVGLNMARTTALGITKVRSAIKASSPTLQINLVSFASPMADIEAIDVESE